MASKPGSIPAEMAMPSGRASGLDGCVMCFLLGRSDGFVLGGYAGVMRSDAGLAMRTVGRSGTLDECDEFAHVTSDAAWRNAEFFHRQARAVEPERRVAK